MRKDYKFYLSVPLVKTMGQEFIQPYDVIRDFGINFIQNNGLIEYLIDLAYCTPTHRIIQICAESDLDFDTIKALLKEYTSTSKYKIPCTCWEKFEYR
jgi:hypothetical protein